MIAEKWDALLIDLRSALHDVATIASDVGPDGRARWELDWSDEDVKFVKDVVRAVCTGKSKEVHAPGRIHVEVSLPMAPL